MIEENQARLPGTVTALRRPPVGQSTMVCRGQRHIFDAFARLTAVIGENLMKAVVFYESGEGLAAKAPG